MLKNFLYCLSFVSLCLCIACGGDDSASGSAGSGAGGASGSHAAGGTGATSAAGSGGAAGSSILDMINMLLMPMCDASVQSATNCGSNSCPAVSDTAAMACMVNCCTSDGQCGTMNTDKRYAQFLGSTCMPPAPPVATDSRCPSMSAGGMTIPGCCTQGRCGVVFGNFCFGGTGQACDQSDAGVAADAGY